MINQEQRPNNLLIQFYFFLRDRDARIIELFFLLLNAYILILVLLPPHSYYGIHLIIRSTFQSTVTVINLAAVIQHTKFIRITSAIANTAIMGLITASLWKSWSPHTGVYALITLLAAFVCWKINVRQ